MVDRQRQAVVPVVPRLLEKEQGQNVKKKDKRTKKTIPVLEVDNRNGGVDAKLQDAIGVTEKSIGVLDEEVKEKPGIPFTAPDSLPSKSETMSLQVTEYDCALENGYQLDSKAQAYSSPSWREHIDGVAPLINTLCQASLQDQEARTSWDHDEQTLPTSLVGHELPPFSSPYSPHYSPSEEPYPADPFPPISGPQVESENCHHMYACYPLKALSSDFRYGQRYLSQVNPSRFNPEPYSYPVKAPNLEFSHNRRILSLLNPSRLFPYNFEKPLTPSTTPAIRFGTIPRLPPRGPMEETANSNMQNGSFVMGNGHLNGSTTNGMQAAATELPARLDQVDSTSTSNRGLPQTNDATTLLEHLLYHFDAPEYADCQLGIHIGNDVKHIKLHAIVIGQSHLLRAMLSSAPVTAESSIKHLEFRILDELGGKYASVAAFSAALLVLYGADAYAMLANLYDETDPSDSSKLDHAIAYLFAGNLLAIRDVQRAGLDAISTNLSLDGLCKALEFALNCGHPQLTTESGTTPVDQRDAYVSYLVSQRTDDSNEHIVNTVFQFMVNNFPVPFVLDTAVPSRMSLGAPKNHAGFPPIEGLSTVIPLGTARFSNGVPPSRRCSVFSEILLSLEYRNVSTLFGAVQDLLPSEAMDEVWEQREVRFADEEAD